MTDVRQMLKIEFCVSIFYVIIRSKNGLFFFIFVFSEVNGKYVEYKCFPMTGFEPRIFGIESNWAAHNH